MITLNLCVKGQQRLHKTEIIVCDDLGMDCLISWSDLQRMGIIPKAFPSVCCKATTNDVKQTLCDEFLDVIKDTLNQDPIVGDKMTIKFRDEFFV